MEDDSSSDGLLPPLLHPGLAALTYLDLEKCNVRLQGLPALTSLSHLSLRCVDVFVEPCAVVRVLDGCPVSSVVVPTLFGSWSAWEAFGCCRPSLTPTSRVCTRFKRTRPHLHIPSHSLTCFLFVPQLPRPS